MRLLSAGPPHVVYHSDLSSYDCRDSSLLGDMTVGMVFRGSPVDIPGGTLEAGSRMHGASRGCTNGVAVA